MDPILSAASRLFRERGIAGASMRAIADEAGLLLGSLTYRYSTKDELLLAIMEAGVAQGVARVREAVAHSDDPVERLRLAFRAHLRLLLTDDSAVWLLLNEWGRLSRETKAALRESRRGYEAVWQELVSDVHEQGLLAPELDLDLAYRFVFGAANSVARWYRPDGRLSADRIADEFATFIGLGVLARPLPEERP